MPLISFLAGSIPALSNSRTDAGKHFWYKASLWWISGVPFGTHYKEHWNVIKVQVGTTLCF